MPRKRPVPVVQGGLEARTPPEAPSGSLPLVFRLPLPLNLANSRMHWAAKHKAQKLWAERADLLVLGQINPKPPKAPWPKATIRAEMVVGNAMDEGNSLNRLKWVEDWLVRRKYILDDRAKCLKWEGLPVQRVSRKNAPSVTITLTEAR